MPISFQLFSMSALGHMLNGSAFIRLRMAMVVPRAFGPIVLLYATGFHRLSDCARDRAATFRKLKRRNPDVCVDDDDHPLDRTLRRDFSARTSLMSRGTSASV